MRYADVTVRRAEFWIVSSFFFFEVALCDCVKDGGSAFDDGAHYGFIKC